MTNIAKSWHDPSLRSVIKTELAATWTSIHSSLLALPSADDAILFLSTHDYIYESCRLAAIILSKQRLRVIDPLSIADIQRQSSGDIKALRNALDRTNLFGFWDPLPGALMWCLAIGASATPKGLRKSWFLVQLARTCIAYSLTNWNEIERSLRMILYSLKNMEEFLEEDVDHN
jgi:hypothetical protein